MKKYIKLIEALGLLLILLSWGLEWSSYKKYEGALSSLIDNFRTIQNMYMDTQQGNELKFQNAITRAVIITNKIKDISVISSEIPEEAWKSDEVRDLWLNKFFGHISVLEKYTKLYENINNKYNLKLKEDILGLRAELEDLKAPLKRVGKLGINMKYKLSDSFTDKSAYEAEKLIKPMFDKSISIFGKISKHLNDKKAKWSIFYKIMYVLGSIALIFPKLYEWQTVNKITEVEKPNNPIKRKGKAPR